MLNKNDILSVDDKKLIEVQVPEWNGSVFVRVMSGGERDKWESDIFDEGKVIKDNFRARLLAKCISDDQGVRLFSDADITALGSKNAKALDSIFAIAKKLNGIGSEEENDLIKKD